MEQEKLRYPTGRFKYGEKYTESDTSHAIKRISEFPEKLRQTISQIPKEKLNLTYRDEGWTGLQVINHLGDVYINAYMRTKWVLTEDRPALKPYDENGCSHLPDSFYSETDITLGILDNLIKRWVFLLRAIPPADFSREIYHPELQLFMRLDEVVATYAWHGYHHIAHLELIKNK